ncbi:MAG: twin-arginine translocase TatA/TatE family subunit [Bacteroidota bacterium]
MIANILTPTFLISLPGGGEWIFIILAIVLLFGAKKIPELARGLGRGIREFKDASKEIKDEIDREGNELKRLDN